MPWFALAGNSTPVLEFTPEQKKVSLFSYIDLLRDQGHQLTIEDISSPSFTQQFKSESSTGNSFGFTKDTFWIRFTLKPAATLQENLYLQLEYPLMDQVTLFIPDGEGHYTDSSTGDTLPFSHREVNHRTFLFRLPDHRGEERTYYMRLQTEGSMQFPIMLWSTSSFIQSQEVDNFFFGIFYGVMLLILLIALVSYYKMKDSLFLYYALYLLSFMLFQHSLNGFSFQFFWPDSTWWTSRASSFFIGFVVFCALLFTGKFLNVWTEHPHIKKLFYLVMGISVVSMITTVFGNYAFAIQLSALQGIILPPVVLIAAITSLLAGYKPARYFLVAWFIFLLSVFIGALLYLGMIQNNFFTFYSMQIGALMEITLLGYALLDRFEKLREEKNSATDEASQYLNQLNYELESLVSQRTRELANKNKLLSELASQDSMTGLLNHKNIIKFVNFQQKTAKRYQHSFSIIMLDIDYFKSINDTYGHQAGDKVIVAVANILRGSIRESDVCGRYGGEEFLISLTKSDGEHAFELAERIRQAIMQLKLPEINNTRITASFGIATYNPAIVESVESAELIHQADQALYQAKNDGRNRIKQHNSHTQLSLLS
jgi:diguanylate cyclase (GGDEF)-like protein